jgi:hypothetical protein
LNGRIHYSLVKSIDYLSIWKQFGFFGNVP